MHVAKYGAFMRTWGFRFSASPGVCGFLRMRRVVTDQADPGLRNPLFQEFVLFRKDAALR